MDTLSAALGLVGVILLAVPALHVDRYARKVSELRDLKRVRVTGRLAQTREDLIEELKRLRDGWRHWKRWCLYFGFGAYGTAAFIHLVRTLL